jgi:hypothetical protein
LPLCTAAILTASSLSAQERLVGAWSGTAGAVYENWSLASAVAVNTAPGTALVKGASQWTIPFGVVVPITPRWTVDAYAAYVRGEVKYAGASGTSSSNALSNALVSGATDAKVRLVGQLRGENLLLTAGLTAPTGATGLSSNALDALDVIASPALRFRSPVLGAGAGGTLGLIFAHTLGGWGAAVATSYEVRGTYSPTEALQSGVAASDLRPGNAVHASAAFERTAGIARHAFSVSWDLYQAGELRDRAKNTPADAFQLGTSVSGTYQVDVTARGLETMFFVVARRRAASSVGRQAIQGSQGTDVDGGVQTVRPLGAALAARLSVDGRYHSAGADVGSQAVSNTVSFSTAGITSAGATLGLRIGGQRGQTTIDPFVHGQVGRLDFKTTTRRASGVSAGITVTAYY